MEGAWLGEHPKIWDTHVFLQPLKLATSNLVDKLGLGLAYQKTTFFTKKQRFGPKMAGVWEHPKKMGPPTFFETVKLATSNLVHKLGLGLAYQKNNVLDQNWRWSGPGEHPKKLGPPTYFCNR